MKRVIDLGLAGAALIISLPLLLLLSLLVLLFLGRPVLFRQTRPGLHGKPFQLLKFRTMKVPASGAADISTDATRLTPFGRLLRATSLDELPQLWSILKGDMSFVGPRPLLMQYLPRYSPEQARRHEVRPGLTGWSQVKGRNALGWDEKLALDVWYVDNRSLALDFRILVLTAWRVIKPQGISAEGSATMPEFRGSATVEPHRKPE